MNDPKPAPLGIDPEPLTAWLTTELGSERLLAPLDFRLLTGGASNLTYELKDARGQRLVLRRPPTGRLLASAHDMSREYRIISALAGSDVPVPEAIGLCTDPAVTGADFYVMGCLEGSIIINRADGLAVTEELRPVMTASLVETLAALHAIDPDEIGLGDLGRHEQYCARQLRRWKRQIDKGSDRRLPLLDELHRELAGSVPLQQGAGIVHGDYRLDNCMMAADGSVAGVLDWELCTLGDVLADVAGLVMWWGHDQETAGRLGDVPASVAGFGNAEDVLDHYSRSSARDLSELRWYLAFQHWRLACIIEGVRVRYAAGALGEQPGYDNQGALFSVNYLLERARQML